MNIGNDLDRLTNLIYVKCVNEKKTYSTPINFCLLNTRSTNTNELFISDYISEIDIDILAMTETWLGEQGNEFSIGKICPTGYHFYHVTRRNSRGGGLSLLLKKVKKHIKVKKHSQRRFSSFEYIDATLDCHSTCTRMILINRPPPTKTNKLRNPIFFEEFCTFVEQLIILPGNILIAGDFHVDKIRDPDTINLNKILQSFDLQQHARQKVNPQERPYFRFDYNKA